MRYVLFFCLLLFSVVGFADEYFPTTFTPEVDVIPSHESCEPEYGKLRCRWAGACVRIGNQCFNCQQGQKFSPYWRVCYICPRDGVLGLDGFCH